MELSFRIYGNVIMGGDVNFILRRGELWRESGRMDPLVNFPLQKIEETRLCDIKPLILKPTWRNRRVGSGGIYKGLNRFLIKKNIVDNLGRIQSWI
jgi:hypothetical protein